MTPGKIIDTRADDHVIVRESWLTGYARPIRDIARMLQCPVCGTGQPEPEHGAPTTCPGCGSRFLRHGQRLRITVGDRKRDDIKIEGNVTLPVYLSSADDPEAESPPVADLMAALEQSVADAKAARDARKRGEAS